MQNLSAKLFDSGRFSLWFRIPALVVGVAALWIGIALGADSLFDVTLGLPLRGARGSPMLGSLACLGIGAVWIFIWFAQLRVFYDTPRQELIVWSRGYLGSHERRVSLAGSRELHIREVRSGLAASMWRVSVEFTDGRSEKLIDIPAGVEPFAKALAEATNLRVTTHEN